MSAYRDFDIYVDIDDNEQQPTSNIKKNRSQSPGPRSHRMTEAMGEMQVHLEAS